MIKLTADIQHKIQWCESLLQNLDSLVTEYIASEPMVATPFPTPLDDGRYLWKLKCELVAEPPMELSLLAGDFIQNLRSSLDYLAQALVLTTGGVPSPGGGPKSTSFPIVTKKKSQRPTIAACSSDEVHYLVEFFQPYEVDDPTAHVLYRINELANEYKHRELRTLTEMAGFPSHFAIIDQSFSPPIGVAAPNLRFLAVGEPFSGVFLVAEEGVTPVVESEFEPVVVLDGGQRPAVSVTDELDYYLRFVRDFLIPSFQPFFADPWPHDLFALQEFEHPKPLGDVPPTEDFIRSFDKFYKRITGGMDNPNIAVLGMIEGVSTEMI